MIEIKKIDDISVLSLVKNYLYMKELIVSEKVYGLLKDYMYKGYVTTNGIFIKLGATLSKKQFEKLKIQGNSKNLFVNLSNFSLYDEYVKIREYVTTAIKIKKIEEIKDNKINYFILDMDKNNKFYLKGEYTYKNRKYKINISDIKIFNQDRYEDDSVVTQAGGNRLRVSISGNNCISGCKFCDFEAGHKNYNKEFLNKDRMEEIINKIHEKLNGNQKKVKNLFITGGNPDIYDLEKWTNFLEESIKTFKKYVPEGNVDVMLTPRGFKKYVYKEDRSKMYYKYIKHLKEIGVNTISPNIELWKQDKLNIFCPSNGKKLNTTKAEIGCDGYIDFIKLGIDVFGKYNVRTALIVGLNTNKEIEEAIDYFLKIGCFVVLSPFKTNNKELKHLEPDIDSLIHLGNYLDEKLEDILRFCKKEEKIMYRKRINNSLNAHNTHNTANFCCKKELDSLEKVVS